VLHQRGKIRNFDAASLWIQNHKASQDSPENRDENHRHVVNRVVDSDIRVRYIFFEKKDVNHFEKYASRGEPLGRPWNQLKAPIRPSHTFPQGSIDNPQCLPSVFTLTSSQTSRINSALFGSEESTTLFPRHLSCAGIYQRYVHHKAQPPHRKTPAGEPYNRTYIQ